MSWSKQSFLFLCLTRFKNIIVRGEGLCSFSSIKGRKTSYKNRLSMAQWEKDFNSILETNVYQGLITLTVGKIWVANKLKSHENEKQKGSRMEYSMFQFFYSEF